MATTQLRLLAKRFASDIVKTLNVEAADRPYVEAVLEEAVLFEQPMPDLNVAVNAIGPDYTITVRGYAKMIDDQEWDKRFMGTQRSHYLSHVKRTYTQLTVEGAVKVILMERVIFNSRPSAASSSAMAADDGDADDAVPEEVVPRFRKRT
jgi:hypothetical protein